MTQCINSGFPLLTFSSHYYSANHYFLKKIYFYKFYKIIVKTSLYLNKIQLFVACKLLRFKNSNYDKQPS